jgi:hypothetical protein
MLPEKVQHELISEIELFIEYSVEESGRNVAKELVQKYRNTPIALAVLLEFYKTLPETREEAVVKLLRINSLQGVTLLAVSTANHTYTAAVSEGEAHILGEFAIDTLPQEIMTYFGYTDNDDFLKSCGEIEKLEEFGVKKEKIFCPACQVAVGELHILGCPVEICPWCDGQLSKCNCRFEKLEVDSLETDEQLEAFQEMLETKGRITYEADQKPAYPGTSKGLDA